MNEQERLDLRNEIEEEIIPTPEETINAAVRKARKLRASVAAYGKPRLSAKAFVKASRIVASINELISEGLFNGEGIGNAGINDAGINDAGINDADPVDNAGAKIECIIVTPDTAKLAGDIERFCEGCEEELDRIGEAKTDAAEKLVTLAKKVRASRNPSAAKVNAHVKAIMAGLEDDIRNPTFLDWAKLKDFGITKQTRLSDIDSADKLKAVLKCVKKQNEGRGIVKDMLTGK